MPLTGENVTLAHFGSRAYYGSPTMCTILLGNRTSILHAGRSQSSRKQTDQEVVLRVGLQKSVRS